MSKREIQIRDAFLAKVASELAIRVDRLGTNGATAAEVAGLRAFTRELLLVAQPESPIELRPERTDLHVLVTGMLAAMRSKKKRVPVDVAVSAKGNTTGHWDASYLETVVAELLSNALKYGGGSTVRVNVEGTRDRVRLTIADGGSGVSAQTRTRLGSRFVRGAGTTRVMGFGVGVWLVRRLVRAHGGTFRLERGHGGNGTRALVSLPRG